MATTSAPELTDLPEGLTDLEREMVEKIDSEMTKLFKQFSGPKAQYDRLAITRNNLLAGENGVAAPTKTTGGSNRPSGSRATRTRVSGSTRKEMFVALVRAQPGITIPQAAAEMDIGANYLYRVRDDAEKEGQIRKEGQQHFPVNPGEPSPARIRELEAAAAS